MIMKKILVFAAALLVSLSAFAQETNRDAQGNIQKGPYETNGFWDNWSLGIAGGVNYLMNGVFSGEYVGTLGVPAIDASLTKWFDPCFGAGFGWQGLRFKSEFDDNQYHYNYGYFDLRWNWTNQFCGYSEKRVYNFIPYLHAGWQWSRFGNCFAAGFGLYNSFRLSNRVNFLIDLRATGGKDPVFGSQEFGINAMVSALAGLNFNFGKANWKRSSTTIAGYAAAVAAAEAAANAAQAAKDKALASEKALADQNKALADENQQLKDELAAASKDNSKFINDILNTPVIAYFEIGKAKLSVKELAHVDYAVKTLIANSKGVKFTLAGNADSKTGSKRRNQQLSQQRADYLYKLLTEKYGLDPSMFTVQANGGNDIFDTPELNRAVIIEKQ